MLDGPIRSSSQILTQKHTDLSQFLASFPKLKGLTKFQQQVLFTTSKIPYGQIVSYQFIATKIGRPKAARAVGNALSKNPYIGEIPCHRVIKSDGSLGGFGVEIQLKLQLLESEGVFFDSSYYLKS